LYRKALYRSEIVKRWFQALDRILRGEATRMSALRAQTIDVPVGGLAAVILLLALSYGACSGLYAGCRPEDPSYRQWCSTTLKVPALFFLTLGVTFPSLYVFNALLGSRLNARAVLQLLIASLGVNLAVLASMGPIVAFFSFSTSSWPFMVLLNVLVYTVAGLLGMVFLLQTLQRLSIAQDLPEPPREVHEPRGPGPEQAPEGGQPAEPIWAQPVEEPSALDRLEGHVLGRHVKTVFYCWMLIFGLVGTQMAWVLRPFFGKAGSEFQWFSPRGSNFFQGVWEALRSLLS
jgi:hypothetical protein